MYLLVCLINTLTRVTYKTTPSISIHINDTKNVYCSTTAITEHTYCVNNTIVLSLLLLPCSQYVQYQLQIAIEQ